MAATLIPGSVFLLHANRLRTRRLEALAQSLRHNNAATAAKKPATPVPVRASRLNPLNHLSSRRP